MEFLIWLGFLLVYSIINARNKKKGPQKGAPGSTPGTQQKAPTLEDALREIQEAFQQASQPNAPAPAPAPEPQAPTQPKPARTKLPPREPEFHSLERRIPDRSLESKTQYSEKILTRGTLEATKTYEDSFPTSDFYDDKYSHPHMEPSSEPLLVTKKKSRGAADLLRKRLADKNYLSEAFIIQQVLGEPLSKKRYK
ncbi:MAG: hypothetical protein AAF564_25840 [Bacteroidota bacterium]